MIHHDRTPARRDPSAACPPAPTSARAHVPAPGSAEPLLAAWRPLVAAEAGAEAPAAGMEPADLEQAVWVRLLEWLSQGAAPGEPAIWVRAVVRAEARRARRQARREVPYEAAGEPAVREDYGTESAVLAAERARVLRAAIGRLPGRCPELMSALLHPCDPTYREIAGTLGISQGSLGPVRSRCLGCLRRMLVSEVGAPQLRAKG
jgi:RNA polymerase sigma factor (sigma-70 family)